MKTWLQEQGFAAPFLDFDKHAGIPPRADWEKTLYPALVRVNDASEYVRRPAAWDTLPPAAHGLLERLVAARLIVRRHDREASVVEVAHEALLRKWPRLRGWLDEERAFLIGKQQLEVDLRDWQSASTTDKNRALLTGLKLSRSQGWLSERPEQLSKDERHFVQASLKRTTWRQRMALTSIIAGLCMALALSAVALLQYRERARQAEIAFANQLLSREALRDTNVHTKGLRSAVQALATLDRLGEDTFDADQSVRKSYAQLAKWTNTKSH